MHHSEQINNQYITLLVYVQIQVKVLVKVKSEIYNSKKDFRSNNNKSMRKKISNPNQHKNSISL